MKVIKLPIQHYYGEERPPENVFVKIDGTETRPFVDMECTKPLDEKIGIVYVEIKVPDELEFIEIPSCGRITPAEDVVLAYDFGIEKGAYKGGCKFEIMWDNGSYEVPVNDEIVDFDTWRNFLEHDETGRWLFAKRWILEVWTMKDKKVGVLRFHQLLIDALFIPKEIKDWPIELSTRNKLPCLWEKGGREKGDTYHAGKGYAIIICRADGKPKKPLFIARKGELACSNHALFRINEGDVIIEANVDSHYNERLSIFKIESIDKKNCVAKVYEIAKYLNKFWRCADIAETYKGAYTAALDKAKCVNCDRPYFVYEK